MAAPPRRRFDRILVTGAGGFLGTHLCTALATNGYRGRVVAFDNFSIGSPKHLERLGSALNIVNGDIRKPADVEPVVAGSDLIFHLAAISDPRQCDKEPELANAVNVEGTRNIVRAARSKRLVFLSSAAVYGPNGSAPISEQHKLTIEGVYARTKAEGEKICLTAAAAGTLEVAVVRNFNTYGGGQSRNFLIPKLVTEGLSKHSIEIWNCQPVRDFTYVADTVGALIDLGHSDVTGEVYNLGSGKGHRVGEIAMTIGSLLRASVSCINRPVSGSPHLVASNAKLRKALGWEPRIQLPKGLKLTVDWYRKNGAFAS